VALHRICGKHIIVSCKSHVVASDIIKPNNRWLIGARGVQGLGAGGLDSLPMVIVSDLYSPRERGKYMGMLGTIFALSSVIGPMIGGGLTDGLSWRWIFYISTATTLLFPFPVFMHAASSLSYDFASCK
jgi:MFS family permease